MKKIADIVNLNADASCLSSKRWLDMLKGGTSSELYRWLLLYATGNKKVTLGIPGSTLSDIKSLNPECLELLRSKPDVFEFILRPYAHDIALLRTSAGFVLNMQLGKKIIGEVLGSFTNFYLPPEFMLTNEQVLLLQQAGIEGTFINYGRFKSELQDRIPRTPYRLKGIMESRLQCIPFESKLTQAYLHGIHNYNAERWNQEISESAEPCIFSWRDGESTFFIPDGNNRESHWLSQETGVQRVFLSEIIPTMTFREPALPYYPYYPTHSFMPWMKESKMLGFLNKIEHIELRLDRMSAAEKALWLQLINSDILSAIEKNSPVITLKTSAGSSPEQSFTIWRSERGVEGEEMLYLATNSEATLSDSEFHIKFRSRLHFLKDYLV